MKILIADDEEYIRSGLRKNIDWDKLGIGKVLMAEDGISALNLCEREHPELIITDIRMPGLNGLDLAKAASERFGAKKVFILSGYSEFEYAKKAIKVGVEEYLLKPVNISELVNLLSVNIKTIRMNLKRDVEIRQKKLKELLTGKQELALSTIKELLYPKEKKIPPEIAIVVARYDKQYGCGTEEKPEEWDELLGDKEILLWKDTEGIVFLEEIENYQERQQYHSKIRNLIGNKGRSAGVSEKGFLREIRKLYRHAEEALTHRMYLGTKQCLFYEQLPDCTEVMHPFLYFDKKAVRESIEIMQIERLKSLISEQFTYLRQRRCKENDIVSELCIVIKNTVFETLKEKDVDIEGILNTNQELFQNQMKFTSLESYEAWITDYCVLMLRGLMDLSGKKYSTTISGAVDFMNQHYMEDISLTRVADEVKKSASYFSSVFKKEMGINFNEYLNQIRVRKAKELLREPDAVIYEVAEKTGFHDYKYFTKVFKRICGCAPSEYMKNK